MSTYYDTMAAEDDQEPFSCYEFIYPRSRKHTVTGYRGGCFVYGVKRSVGGRIEFYRCQASGCECVTFELTIRNYTEPQIAAGEKGR